MIKETKTTLLCSWCFKESPILITSVGGFIVRMKCQRCGHIFKVPAEMFYFSLFSQLSNESYHQALQNSKGNRKMHRKLS